MAHWLMKSEADTWSWDNQVAAGAKGTGWDGVRNHQAKAHLKAMAIGDTAFFYHSGDERAVVGVIEVVGAYKPDPSDEKGIFGMVQVSARDPLPHSVTLAAIKAEPRLKDMVLVKNSRLSVQPVTPAEWNAVLSMAKKPA